MLKIMKENIKLKNVEDENSNVEEIGRMMEIDDAICIDMNEEEKKLWREVFQKLVIIDNNETEEIDIEKLIHVILELNESTIVCWWRGGTELDRDELATIFFRIDTNNNGLISVEEFCRMWAKDCTEVSRKKKDFIKNSLKAVAFAKNIKMCPPRLFIPMISVLQITLFIIYSTGVSKQEDIESPHQNTSTYFYLIFKGSLRSEAWRYLSYCLVHKEIEHLMMVLLVQLSAGILMELVHGSFRIGPIYISGVVAGALASYAFNPHTNLLGGSGGCYSLLGAHLATLILNWNEDQAIIYSRVRAHKMPKMLHGKLMRNLKLLAILLYIVFDVILAAYSYEGGISYAAHVFGFLSGLLIGFIVIKDRVEKTWERNLKIGCALLYIALLVIGVIFNIGAFKL